MCYIHTAGTDRVVSARGNETEPLVIECLRPSRMQNRNASCETNGIKETKKINNVKELCLASAAIALVVEVDGDRFGVVCVEITALFLGQSVACDDWHMLVLAG
jgi:hypothetical protein